MNSVSIPNLSDRAMLCYVSLSIWSARKLDKKQTLKTIAAAGATNDAARVNKHLLANADEALRAIQRKGNEIRAYIESNTLPWDDAGNRLLSNEQALAVVGHVGQLEIEFNELVDEFVMQYPALRAQAVANLGGMGDDSEYPQPDEVRSKFKVKVSFTPLPTGFGDLRVGMSEQQAKAWQSHFEAVVRNQTEDALKAAWERLRNNLAKYSDRLTPQEDGKPAIFRDSMVESLRDTVQLLSSLNVFDNDELARTCDYVSREIARYEPDTLRNSPAAAALVKSEADELLAKMKEMLGE